MLMVRSVKGQTLGSGLSAKPDERLCSTPGLSDQTAESRPGSQQVSQYIRDTALASTEARSYGTGHPGAPG